MMPEENVEAWYRRTVEERVREQIARHRTVDAKADTRQIIEIQIRQEEERLDKLVKEQPKFAVAARALKEWLREFARTLK